MLQFLVSLRVFHGDEDADAGALVAAAGEALDVAAVAVRLPGVPGVDLFAFDPGHGLGAAVGGEDLAVQDHVRDSLGHRPLQRFGQARGLLR